MTQPASRINSRNSPHAHRRQLYPPLTGFERPAAERDLWAAKRFDLGVWQDRCKTGGLNARQLIWAHAKVMSRSCFNAKNAFVELGHVQVNFEYAPFRPRGLDIG